MSPVQIWSGPRFFYLEMFLKLIQVDKFMKLNLGCGDKKIKGFTNVDSNKEFDPDILCDLSKYPWPFKDGEVDFVLLEMLLEHVSDTTSVIKEVHRILKPGGIVKIIVPHYLHQSAWRDPDHKKAFAPDSFRYFDHRYAWFSKYNKVKFEIIKEKVVGIHYKNFNFFFFLPNRVLKLLSYYIPGIAEDIVVELKKV